VNQDVTKHVPVNHEPIDKYEVGRRINPDQPIKINLSLFNQSSNKLIDPARNPFFEIKLAE
jgi:hypothetical protein